MLEFLAQDEYEQVMLGLGRRWRHVLCHIGYDHQADRYMPHDLLPVLLSDMALPPDASDKQRAEMWSTLGWRATCAADPDYAAQVSEQDNWDEAVQVFGWQFDDTGMLVDEYDYDA